MVCSRPIVSKATNGREKIMSSIYHSLLAGGHVEVLVLRSHLESRTIGGILAMIKKFIGRLILGSRMPLQALLFWSPHHQKLIEDSIDRLSPTTVYFDGVRSGAYLPNLRKRYKNLRMVCDFDDLMSRRMTNLASKRQPVSLGYLSKYVPVLILECIYKPLASSIIPKYEARALLELEAQIIASANAITLLSSFEVNLLKSTLSHDNGQKIINIPPPFPRALPNKKVSEIQRFVFVGSDSQLQNRLTIEFLVDLWLRTHPLIPLHIYGQQKENYAQVPGIVVHGYVADISHAYAPGSLMLAPSFVSGGVKTKVLEAFAHGITVVGNETTFEGIDAPTQPLIMNSEELELLVRAPNDFAEKLGHYSQIAINIAQSRHNSISFSRRWRNIVWPGQNSIHLDC
jgi:glycosyltransferase involved in cell wall biosynthesis